MSQTRRRGCVVRRDQSDSGQRRAIRGLDGYAAERLAERALAAGSGIMCVVQELRRFFKANPQALVLLIICVVLGLGTFLAVLFGVVTSKTPTKPSGEPVGSVGARMALVRPV